MGEKRSNHTGYNINYHFVWCPKYGYEILSLHISPDHVHLFLSAHPKHIPSEIVRSVKNITAREMWEQH
jgi:putative transposase